MRLRSCVLALALFTALLAANHVSAQREASYADAVIVHGKIYKLNSKQPWAEAFAIRGDHIIAVGSDAEIAKLQSNNTQVIDAQGRLVLPGFAQKGFVPTERLNVADAIRGYTLGAAYAGFREKTEGSLEPGKLADLIILSRNLFEVEPHSISQTKVLTIIGGRVVFQAQ